jgi:ribosomal protein S4
VLAKKTQTPQWISFDPKALKGKVLSIPKQEEAGLNVDVATVIEFYSRA